MSGEPPKAEHGCGSARAADDVTAETSADKIVEGSVTRITREKSSDALCCEGVMASCTCVAVNSSHNVDTVPVLCGAAAMDSGEIDDGYPKAGLAKCVIDAMAFRQLLAFYPRMARAHVWQDNRGETATRQTFRMGSEPHRSKTWL